MSFKQIRLCVTAIGCFLFTAFGCSSESAPELGQVRLALTGAADGFQYELVDAAFQVKGSIDETLSPADSVEEVSIALPTGEYTIELLDGWTLVQLVGTDRVAVDARLLTETPLVFQIETDATTQLVYQFEVGATHIALGAGSLVIGLDVQVVPAVQVVISEVMKNPAALPDSDGEWIELTNSGSEPIQLQGCSIERGSSSMTIDEPLLLEVASSVALASSDQPGFVPSYVYSGLTLPNSSVLEIAIRCDGQLLDAIALDSSVLSNAAGHSWSLSADALSPEANDATSAWCDAVDQYSEDFGTPGELNPVCSPVVASE